MRQSNPKATSLHYVNKRTLLKSFKTCNMGTRHARHSQLRNAQEATCFKMKISITSRTFPKWVKEWTQRGSNYEKTCEIAWCTRSKVLMTRSTRVFALILCSASKICRTVWFPIILLPSSNSTMRHLFNWKNRVTNCRRRVNSTRKHLRATI